MKFSRRKGEKILDRLVALRANIVREAEDLVNRWAPQITRKSYEYSAFNVACYLALRRRDLRSTQKALVPLGLSSLGRCEGHVLASLDAVIAALTAICHPQNRVGVEGPSLRHFTNAQTILDRHTRALLPKPASRRRTRIMVTLPVEAAMEYRWMRDIVTRGMDCARINCAHDTPKEWLRMVRNVRKAEHEVGRKCAVLMDLCGPRARVSDVRLAVAHQRVHDRDQIWLGNEFQLHDQIAPFQAICSIPQIVEQIAPNATVWMNDGRIGAKVLTHANNGLLLKVFHARKKGEKFRADMGLNFPKSHLKVSALTPKDQADLDFIAQHADAVGYSFVQEPEDMDSLAEEIERRASLRGRLKPLGVVAKIETERALHNLPELIVRGAGRGPFGVMIARGDLAVEIGYLRLAEIQEEILWLCEAAHIPVIWATQVLEGFAKKGLPSRAEITDAAMSERAECVMLNKGPFIPETVTILSDILGCMQAHQWKKMSTFRALHSWNHLWQKKPRAVEDKLPQGEVHSREA